MLATEVDGEGVVVRYADPEHRADKVGVWAHLHLGDTTMHEIDGGWEIRLTGLPVERLEYLIDVDGDLRPDATNPRTVPGPFGEHSWLPLPGYQEPAWLGRDETPGERTAISLSRTGAGRIDAEIWSPVESAAEPLPLLISHDGPEMDAYGGLTSYVASMVAAGTLPPIRVALVSPGPRRNKRYAASAAYSRALTNRLLPALTDAVATTGRPVLIGQSLGALAALHAAWTSPDAFDGLFLQSGSYFTPELDPQESGFEYWSEVTGFVASVHAATRAAPGAPPTSLVCGTAEENHADNVLMRDHLSRIGVETVWGEVRQGHTWTCWRDTLHPQLTDLLTRVWA